MCFILQFTRRHFRVACTILCRLFQRLITQPAPRVVIRLRLLFIKHICPAGTPCVGYFIGNFAPGGTVEEILRNLRDRFCGCTHVTGSIQIDMFGNSDYTNLTEDSFNFLYHVEEISGVLRFQNIPPVSRIVLPNLRIIRGDDLIATSGGRGLALVLLETRIGALVMPNLTEVTRGDVRFQNTSSMCNYKTINWNDIIDNGQLDELLACNTPQPGGERQFGVWFAHWVWLVTYGKCNTS